MNAKTWVTTPAIWLATVAPALAAERVDHSGILVWAFLGLCALIIVAQAFPALLLVLGLVKGLAAKRVKQEAEG